jgi:hypothetical protein
MSYGFLLDEHLPLWWRAALLRRQPHLRVWRVGDPGAPALHSPDPVILEWCEMNGFMLVTNNRRSMPQHLADHEARGRHVFGIFVASPALSFDDLATDLSLIEGASLPDEYLDQIRFLPIT